MQIRAKVTGLSELIADNKKVIRLLESGALTKRIAKKVKKRAKYRAPRKSGKLIRSIDFRMTGKNSFKLICTAVNEKGVAYPAILEYGLSRFIPIGSVENPKIITSGGGKTAYLPFLRWALHVTTLEKNKIAQEIVNCYK